MSLATDEEIKGLDKENGNSASLSLLVEADVRHIKSKSRDKDTFLEKLDAKESLSQTGRGRFPSSLANRESRKSYSGHIDAVIQDLRHDPLAEVARVAAAAVVPKNDAQLKTNTLNFGSSRNPTFPKEPPMNGTVATTNNPIAKVTGSALSAGNVGVRQTSLSPVHGAAPPPPFLMVGRQSPQLSALPQRLTNVETDPLALILAALPQPPGLPIRLGVRPTRRPQYVSGRGGGGRGGEPNLSSPLQSAIFSSSNIGGMFSSSIAPRVYAVSTTETPSPDLSVKNSSNSTGKQAGSSGSAAFSNTEQQPPPQQQQQQQQQLQQFVSMRTATPPQGTVSPSRSLLSDDAPSSPLRTRRGKQTADYWGSSSPVPSVAPGRAASPSPTASSVASSSDSRPFYTQPGDQVQAFAPLTRPGNSSASGRPRSSGIQRNAFRVKNPSTGNVAYGTNGRGPAHGLATSTAASLQLVVGPGRCGTSGGAEGGALTSSQSLGDVASVGAPRKEEGSLEILLRQALEKLGCLDAAPSIPSALLSLLDPATRAKLLAESVGSPAARNVASAAQAVKRGAFLRVAPLSRKPNHRVSSVVTPQLPNANSIPGGILMNNEGVSSTEPRARALCRDSNSTGSSGSTGSTGSSGWSCGSCGSAADSCGSSSAVTECNISIYDQGSRGNVGGPGGRLRPSLSKADLNGVRGQKVIGSASNSSLSEYNPVFAEDPRSSSFGQPAQGNWNQLSEALSFGESRSSTRLLFEGETEEGEEARKNCGLPPLYPSTFGGSASKSADFPSGALGMAMAAENSMPRLQYVAGGAGSPIPLVFSSDSGCVQGDGGAARQTAIAATGIRSRSEYINPQERRLKDGDEVFLSSIYSEVGPLPHPSPGIADDNLASASPGKREGGADTWFDDSLVTSAGSDSRFNRSIEWNPSPCFTNSFKSNEDGDRSVTNTNPSAGARRGGGGSSLDPGRAYSQEIRADGFGGGGWNPRVGIDYGNHPGGVAATDSLSRYSSCASVLPAQPCGTVSDIMTLVAQRTPALKAYLEGEGQLRRMRRNLAALPSASSSLPALATSTTTSGAGWASKVLTGAGAAGGAVPGANELMSGVGSRAATDAAACRDRKDTVFFGSDNPSVGNSRGVHMSISNGSPVPLAGERSGSSPFTVSSKADGGGGQNLAPLKKTYAKQRASSSVRNLLLVSSSSGVAGVADGIVHSHSDTLSYTDTYATGDRFTANAAGGARNLELSISCCKEDSRAFSKPAGKDGLTSSSFTGTRAAVPSGVSVSQDIYTEAAGRGGGGAVGESLRSTLPLSLTLPSTALDACGPWEMDSPHAGALTPHFSCSNAVC